jgi:DNA-binding CsgD family transcriptional regulator
MTSTASWSDVAQFGESVCGTLQPALVQQRALPASARLLSAHSGGIQFFNGRMRTMLATCVGSPSSVLYEFDGIHRENEFLRRALECRFPVHDMIVHPNLGQHHRHAVGKVLAGYGLEHCLFIPLIHHGRLVGSMAVSRRQGSPEFTIDDQRLAERLSRFVSIALANAMAHEEVAGPTPIPTPQATDVRVQTIRFDHGPHPAVHPAAGVDALRDTLSAREIEVFELVATGLTNVEVARELNIAVNTVKQHLKQVYRKLGVRSRLEAAQYDATRAQMRELT